MERGFCPGTAETRPLKPLKPLPEPPQVGREPRRGGRPLSPASRRSAWPCESSGTRTDSFLCPPVQRRVLPTKTQAPKRPGPIQFASPNDAPVDDTEAG